MALSFNSTGFSDSLVILGAAGLVIPAFARFRINPVIGFILVGLLVGPAGLGSFVDRAPWLYYLTISDPHAIEPFAELGIVLLLFAIGLELSFKRLWAMRGSVFGLGASELILSGLVISLGLNLLGQGWGGALGLGFALALSSTALVLPMVGTEGAVGRNAFAMLLFEDLALVPIIFMLGALSPQAGSGGWQGLATTLLLGALTVGLIYFAGRLLLPRIFAQAARTKSPELFLSTSLLVVILASAATTAAGLSPIVGALIAGLLIAETDYRHDVEAITAPFRGLALGVFLITVGMSLDLRLIAANWLGLVAALAAIIVAKAAITAALLKFSGGRAGVASETGLLMASPSETTLIVLAAASSAGLIQPSTAAFWQIVTALGLTVTPLLAQAGRAVARRVEDSENAADTAEAIDAAGSVRSTVIVGCGRVGRLVAQMLQVHGIPYLALDADIDAVRNARRNGYSATFGDIARPGMIDRLKLDHARALVLTMDDPAQVARITARVRAAFPALTIVARARDAAHAAELYKAGVTDAVPETLESSLQLSEAVLVDLGIAMGPVIASIHEKRAELRTRIMEMAELDREPPINRHRLGDALERAKVSQDETVPSSGSLRGSEAIDV